MALRPFPKGPERVIEDSWRCLSPEAGRSAQGIKASIVLSNGTDRKRHTIALGSPTQQKALVADFAAESGLEPAKIAVALAELSTAIEGALRLLEAHEPQTGKTAKPEAGSALTFETIDPWPTSVNGAQLLTELADTYEEHLNLPKGGKEALALWTMHAYTFEAGNISPRLGAISATKRSGKTRLLETVSLLTPRVLLSSNTSSAVIFRAIELWKPTLLIDEADTTLPGNEELRGILNSGHTRRTAFVLRTVKIGEEHTPRKFSTWAPLAVAMIGKLPGTLADRSIVLQMRRKKPTEKVKRLPLDDASQPFADLRRQCARWAADHYDTLRTYQPTVPDGLHDRAADNWRPLCAIAEVAKGEWPARVREAITALGDLAQDDDDAGVLLLQDMQQLFQEKKTDRFFSEDLATALHAMEDRPWPEYGRRQPKPISVNQIARLLKPFKIAPRNVRIDERQAKGYLRDDCQDIFSRYVPHSQTVPPSQASNDAAKGDSQTVPREDYGTDRKSQNPASNQAWDGGTDWKGDTDEKNGNATSTPGIPLAFSTPSGQHLPCTKCGGREWWQDGNDFGCVRCSPQVADDEDNDIGVPI